MNRNRTDSAIRELFQRMREEEEASTPSFETLLQASQKDKGAGTSRTSWHWRPAVTALVLILLISPVFYWLTREVNQPQEEVSLDLFEWESATDFLLTFTDDSLWTTLPTIETDVPMWVGQQELKTFEQ